MERILHLLYSIQKSRSELMVLSNNLFRHSVLRSSVILMIVIILLV